MTTSSNQPDHDGPASDGPGGGPARGPSSVVAVSILFILVVAGALGVVWMWNDLGVSEPTGETAPSAILEDAERAAGVEETRPARTPVTKARPRSADRLEHDAATIDADRRRDQEDLAPDQEVDAEELARYERRLRERIRQRRTLAQQGDLLNSELVEHLRSIVQELLAGPDGNEVLATLRDENPGPVELEVNEPYPADHVATVPPSLLQRFPVLPEGIEYRFAGCSLFLLEVDTELVLDYVSDCLW